MALSGGHGGRLLQPCITRLQGPAAAAAPAVPARQRTCAARCRTAAPPAPPGPRCRGAPPPPRAPAGRAPGRQGVLDWMARAAHREGAPAGCRLACMLPSSGRGSAGGGTQPQPQPARPARAEPPCHARLRDAARLVAALDQLAGVVLLAVLRLPPALHVLVACTREPGGRRAEGEAGAAGVRAARSLPALARAGALPPVRPPPLAAPLAAPASHPVRPGATRPPAYPRGWAGPRTRARPSPAAGGPAAPRP